MREEALVAQFAELTLGYEEDFRDLLDVVADRLRKRFEERLGTAADQA